MRRSGVSSMRNGMTVAPASKRRHELVEDVGRPKTDIARGNPATYARCLQPVADGVGRSLIGDGVADEDVVGQAALPC
ncbi:MAG: hypothetical protein USCAAHI_02119 [Beijerinckiaceae bacterium]|nr:MAG: hypothetical protein USCAAHI_02119 [Beijerinckiaceae bacterium]